MLNPSNIGLIFILAVSRSTVETDIEYLKTKELNLQIHFTGILSPARRILIFMSLQKCSWSATPTRHCYGIMAL